MDRRWPHAGLWVPGNVEFNQGLPPDCLPRLNRQQGSRASVGVALQQADYPFRRLRFGIFEADLRTGRLTRNGRRVRLQEQPFRLLTMLLEEPGQLVTRDTLHSRLWPTTTIDFDHGLNKAISKIRDALGDAAENPRFVETVARRGYRFLGDVSVVGDERIFGRA